MKAGDGFGVGPQVLSSLECERCKNSNEQYCQVDVV